MPEKVPPTTLEEALDQLKQADADVEKWKALSRKNEERAKENVDAAKERDALQKQLDEAEAAKVKDLDEVGKLQKRLDEVDAKLKESQDARIAAERRELKSRIARDKKLPDAIAELLQGDDEEALIAHADKLLEVVSPVDPLGEIDTGAGKGGSQVKADAFKAAIDAAIPTREPAPAKE